MTEQVEIVRKISMRRMVFITCLSLLALLFNACGRKIEKLPAESSSKKVEKNAPASKPKEISNEVQERPPGMTVPEKRKTLALKVDKTNEKVTATATPAKLYTGKESLLSERPWETIMPEDFSIGELLDPDGGDSSGIFIVVRNFFHFFHEGIIQKKLIDSDVSGLLVRFLSDTLDKGLLPDYVRIGKIESSEDGIRVNIRLFKDQGRSDGEVFLVKKEGTWYISDIQVDFYALQGEYKTPGEFEPSVYKKFSTY